MSVTNLQDHRRALDETRRKLDGGGGGPHPPDMEQRVAKLESEVGEIKGLLADKIMPMLIRIDERTTHMASKSDTEALRAELGDKPGKTYMWAVLGVLVATILAAVAVGASIK